MRRANILATEACIRVRTSPVSAGGAPDGITVPRWVVIVLALFICLVVIPLAHGGVPWFISTRMHRWGWTGAGPGFWNWLGLIPVGAGTVLLLWLLLLGIAQAPARAKLGVTSSVLLTSGPYRFTRNPMYVAELALWLGWTVFFGSIGVLIGLGVLLATVYFVLVPLEESGLESAFGDVYLQYKDRVPRWFTK
jgi:protein-S-isoprenylcysteine O-methyltransferase Ste14